MEDRKTRDHHRAVSVGQFLAIIVGATFAFTVMIFVLPMYANRRGHDLHRAESQSRGALRSLVMGEQVFCFQAIVDQDGDGDGEFGWLAEVSATVAPRGRAEPLSEPLALGRAADVEWFNGVLRDGTYCYVVYLPDGQGGWTREGSSLPAPQPALADAQERDFRAYAWPAEKDGLGIRAFAIDSSAVLRASPHDDAPTYWGPQNIPPADVAFSPTSSWKLKD